MAQQPFPKESRLTSIVLAYRNEAMIADEILPITPVPTPEFRWTKYDLAAPFRIPDTFVGRKSRTNAVETNATEDTSSTEDHGLEYPVPQRDIERQTETFRPIERATEWLAQLMAMSREKRVADMVFNAGLYPSTNKETLSGAAQFSDPNSDPIGKLLDAMDGLIMRPNKIVMGQRVWSKLRRHPDLLQGFHGNEGKKGVIPKSYFADLLEVEESAIVVGRGWGNFANVGQPPDMRKLWGNHILMCYTDKLAGPQTGLTFGMTAKFGEAFAGRIADPHMGLRGGTIVRTGWEIRELVMAPWLGYFIQNAVA